MALIDGEPHFSKMVPVDPQKPTDEDFEAFWSVYEEFYKDLECAVHFRMRTSGNVDLENCHPYEIGDGVLLMHNGVITSVPEKYVEYSDTWHLGELIQPMAEKGWLTEPKFIEMLTHLVDKGNKLVLLDKHGFHFVNQDEGTEYQGLWYSNTYAWTHPDHKKWYKKYTTKWFGKSLSTGSTDENVYLADGTVYELKDGGSNITMDEAIDAKVLAGMSEEEMDNLTSEIERDYKALETTISYEGANMIEIPKNLVEWAALDLTEVMDIAMEEPEEVAEAFFELLQR